jgi:catalase
MQCDPFYRSDDLVQLLNQDLGGFHPGYRAVHASGRLYAGTFQATAVAKQASRAVHLQGELIPATVRLSSNFSGDPAAAPASVNGMATKFYLPDGQVTDVIAVGIPVFLVRTPDELLELLQLQRPSPDGGPADPAAIQAFLATHPATARALQMLQMLPGPVSFAQSAYHAIHAYRFVNAAGVGRFARYHWQPVAEVASQPLAQLRERPVDHLYEELERRLQGGPVAFTLELEFAEDGDPTDDCTVLWPEGRERITIGRLELTRPISLEELGDPVMLHDATRVTDGIELSADPILQVRRGAYRASVALRTGGWQQRQAAAAERAPAPFHAP